MQDDLEAAADSYRRALALEPDSAGSHNNLGTALRKQGMLTDAVAAFGVALTLKPDYAAAHTNLGVALNL